VCKVLAGSEDLLREGREGESYRHTAGRETGRERMAVAAFKSTTRRTCDIRGVEVDMPATPRSRNTSPVRRSRPTSPVRRMPSTPRSRPTSPTKHQQPAKQQNERMHRRTRSFADLSSSSPHHFTDPSSMTAAAAPENPRSRASLGSRSSAHHLLPSDSEVSSLCYFFFFFFFFLLTYLRSAALLWKQKVRGKSLDGVLFIAE
jgi:hypothetical protein